mgnify:CR=1 FL=1
MNKADLVDRLEVRLGSKKAALEAVEAVVDVIIREVAAGNKVGITGFGTFERVDRAARTGRNPQTGAEIEIPAGYAAKVTAEDRAVQRDAFIAAMVWGYGRVGCGPSRGERIMAQPGFEEQLADVTRITLEQGGPASSTPWCAPGSPSM